MTIRTNNSQNTFYVYLRRVSDDATSFGLYLQSIVFCYLFCYFKKLASPYNMFVLPKEIGDLGEI